MKKVAEDVSQFSETLSVLALTLKAKVRLLFHLSLQSDFIAQDSDVHLED
jgi:hypothetical protein